MNNKKKYFIGLLFCTAILSAQQFPFLTDPGSLAGSGASAGLYVGLNNKDKDNMRKMNAFQKDYVKRQVYFIGSAAVITNKINADIVTAFDRYNRLRSRNKSLTLFSHSKKKNNTKLLDLIRDMLTNMQKEMLTQKSNHVIYGEKLNLLQNTMQSLSEIHRMMDTVEDNIEKTKLYYRFFN